MDELVGVAEIANMFGITRQRVDQLIRQGPDFPAPDATITAGRIWRRDAIIAWAKATGRAIVGEG
jgi:prophage regulatory protein